jgi:hypothetical protein
MREGRAIVRKFKVTRLRVELAIVLVAAVCIETGFASMGDYFANKARSHWDAAVACQLSSEGKTHSISLMGPDGCRDVPIPIARTEAERAEMAERAAYHARMGKIWDLLAN